MAAYPKVFIHRTSRFPPLVVRNAQEEAALDTAEWMPVSQPRVPDDGTYPKLMYNVNSPPIIVFDRRQEDALGGSWRPSPVVVPSDPAVSLDPASASIGISGGSGSFNVTITGYGKSHVWTATKDDFADWLSFTPTGAQNTDGTVNYTCASNTGIGHQQRDAHIYVNGETFTISQAG